MSKHFASDTQPDGDEDAKLLKIELPGYLGITAAHGSAKVPEELKPFLNPDFSVIDQLNFSDFATGEIVGLFDGANIVGPPPFGRIAGDPNRALGTPLRTVDFGGIDIFAHSINDTELKEVATELQQEIKAYQHQVLSTMKRIGEASSARGIRGLFIDLHDTGNYLRQKYGKQKPRPIVYDDKTGKLTTYDGKDFGEKFSGFPLAIVSDCNSNDSASAEKSVAYRFAWELDRRLRRFATDTDFAPEDCSEDLYGGVLYDDYYHGGAITEMGKKVREKYPNFSALQIEINRGLYMDEVTQQIDYDRLFKIAEILYEVMMTVVTASPVRYSTISGMTKQPKVTA